MNGIEGLFGAQVTGANMVSEVQGADALRRSKDRLPVDGTSGDQAENWKRLGFVLGDVLNEDASLFRRVVFPTGWALRHDEVDMRHMVVVDDKGRVRGSVSYKNTPYDKYANCYLKRRFDTTYASIVYGRDLHESDATVVIDTTTKWPDYKVISEVFTKPEVCPPGVDRWDWGEMGSKAAMAWMAEKYPMWGDPAAYWDDEIPGTVVLANQRARR